MDGKSDKIDACSFLGKCIYRQACACGGAVNKHCKPRGRIGFSYLVEADDDSYCKARMAYGSSLICLCPARNAARKKSEEER